MINPKSTVGQQNHNLGQFGFSHQSPFVLSGTCLDREQNVSQENMCASKTLGSNSQCSYSSAVEPLKIQSLKFNNQEETYRSFKIRFQRVMKMVDKDLQVEYLIQCLDGEALRLAMMYIEDTSALELIWVSLDQRYGNDVVAYHHHSQKLLTLSSYPQCETSEELKELFYVFKENTLAMRRISRNSTAGEDFKSILCKALPDHLQRKVFKTMRDTPKQYTLDHLLSLVNKEVNLNNLQYRCTSTVCQHSAEDHQREGNDSNANIASNRTSSIGVGNLDHPPPTTCATIFPNIPKISSSSYSERIPTQCQSTYHRAQHETLFCKNEAMTSPCMFCGEQHLSKDCTIYKDGQQFLSILRVQRRCFNCFSPTHQVCSCPHISSCGYSLCNWKRKHAPFICKFRPHAVPGPEVSLDSPTSIINQQLQKSKDDLTKMERDAKRRDDAEEKLKTDMEKLHIELLQQSKVIKHINEEKDSLAAQLNGLKQDLQKKDEAQAMSKIEKHLDKGKHFPKHSHNYSLDHAAALSTVRYATQKVSRLKEIMAAYGLKTFLEGNPWLMKSAHSAASKNVLNIIKETSVGWVPEHVHKFEHLESTIAHNQTQQIEIEVN